jgi:membrane protease YdiL (CAAX protease family)
MERITTSHPPDPPPILEPSAEEGAPPPRDRFAEDLRGFGPLGIAAILAILLTGNVMVAPMVTIPIGATLALVWAWRSRTPWREIGYVRPRSWVATVAGGVLFGSALKLLMKAVVMPLFGADPINQSYHFLAGNTALLPAAVWAMLVAGFGEETVIRGYAFERLGKLMGRGAPAKAAIVVVTSLWFGLEHYQFQGLAGTEQATVTGLVWGTIFAITGRLPLLMIAHAAFDLMALALIYWNLESRVAHWVFR